MKIKKSSHCEFRKSNIPIAYHVNLLDKEKCPECNSDSLQHEGRCYTCRNCGWSKCG